MKMICHILFLFLSLFVIIREGAAAGFEDKTSLIAGVTSIKRSPGEDGWIYELTGIFPGSGNRTLYTLGLEIRDEIIFKKESLLESQLGGLNLLDLLNLPSLNGAAGSDAVKKEHFTTTFGRLGFLHGIPLTTADELYLGTDYWGGKDSNDKLWNIIYLYGLLKRSDGILLGLSYKGFFTPGDDMNLASLKAGYYNSAMIITGEFFDSLNSSAKIRSFVMKGEFFGERNSFFIGGSTGKTVVSYIQIAAGRSFNTKEGFMGFTHRWGDSLSLTLSWSRAYHDILRQDSFSAVINTRF